MLTSLIQPRHIEWLGDVEWDTKYERHSLCLYDGGFWHIDTLYTYRKGTGTLCVSAHEASCILEHAIRVKLGINAPFIAKDGSFYSRLLSGYYATYEEALLAAVDALIEREKDD